MNTAALHAANTEVIVGLKDMLREQHFGVGKTSAAHLFWMCNELLAQLPYMSPDKSGRWIGYIQGVMAAHGALDVDEERNRTRPLYAAAYASEPNES
jgi:hypothetical protein